MDPIFWSLLVIPFLLGSKSSSNSKTSHVHSNIPNDIKNVGNIPFAIGSANSIWPIGKTKNTRWNEVAYKKINGKYNGNPSRAFGAIRSDGDRYHVGIDLYSNDGDPCVACEDGIVLGTQGFLNITKALLFQTSNGIVLLYGEIRNNSWEEFGIKKGSFVKKGYPLCRVGYNEAGTAMLHFETYVKGTDKNIKWSVGQQPSPQILNPTKYLIKCLNNSKNRNILVL